MGFFRIHWIVFLALGIVIPCMGNSLSKLDQARQNLVTAQKRVAQKNQEMKKTSDELDDLSKEIETLKTHPDRKAWNDYSLQRRLTRAQELSTSLSQIMNEKQPLLQELHEAQQELSKQLDQKIQQEKKVLSKCKTPSPQRSRVAQSLEKLLAERLTLPSNGYGPSVSLPKTSNPKDSSRQELREKLDAFVDLEQQLSRQVSLLEKRLQETKQQHFLTRELAHLLEEESFFGEQGFIRRPSHSTNSKTNVPSTMVLTKPSDSSSASSAPTSLSPTPSPFDPSTPLASISPSSSVPSSSPAEPSSESSGTHSLPTDSSISSSPDLSSSNGETSPSESSGTQVASSSLGVENQKNTRESLEPSSGPTPISSAPTVSLQTQIRWLEDQLIHTKQTLNALRQQIDELEKNLKP